MRETNDRLNAAEQKEKICARYKGVSIEELDVIPAAPVENFYEDTNKKRVAVYARVSTDNPQQTTSFELQKNYYTETIGRHPGWNLVQIYADEGISGTSLRHRDAFIRMIHDCKSGKVDLIVTKSVSRFSRNVLDCIGYVRELKALQPPIGVFFETENIYTLNPDSEMSLSFISTLAQEESHSKSKSMNMSIEMRFSSGIFLTPALLGYDLDDEGNLVINEEEAKTVRLIFFMYLYGYTCQQIADKLSSLGRTTKKHNNEWSPGSVLQILQNERHCGDVLSRKTWTPSYLDHKSRKNKQNKPQYRHKNHHEPIISRNDFIAVSHLISNAKYGNKEILPEIKVVSEGALKGFVSINPRWAGFTADDYIRASRSVRSTDMDVLTDDAEIRVQPGDLDLRGYEIVRSQFFDTARKTCATFSIKKLYFGIECIRKMGNVPFIELLIYPDEYLLAIRAAPSGNRNAVKWTVLKGTANQPRNISGAAFLKTVFDIFGWRTDCKYRVRGIRKQNANDSICLFDMREIEVFIPSDQVPPYDESLLSYPKSIACFDIRSIISTPNTVCAYPADWVSSFGSDYYRHAQSTEIAIFSKSGEWNIQSEGTSFNELILPITRMEDVKAEIDHIIEETKQKGK